MNIKNLPLLTMDYNYMFHVEIVSKYLCFNTCVFLCLRKITKNK